MKNLFNNQLGFSLVQGMIIAGVVAGSGLVATRLITDQKLAQKSAETRDQIEDLHSTAYAALQNRDNCKATFEGNGLGASLLTATGSTGIQLPSIQAVNSPVPVLKIHGGTLDTSAASVASGNSNTYMNGNVLVKDMRVVYVPADGKARLDITYERLVKDNNKRMKDGYGAKEIKKSIDLRVQRNPFVAGKPFQSCYGITNSKTGDDSLEQGNDVNKELCRQMNNNINSDGSFTGTSVFVWDEMTSTCIPNAKCPDHQIYMGIKTNGEVICERMQDVVDLNSMIQPTVGTCGSGKKVFFRASADNKTVQIVCE